MTARTASVMPSAEPVGLRPVQLAWLAAAVFVVSAGYGALLEKISARILMGAGHRSLHA